MAECQLPVSQQNIRRPDVSGEEREHSASAAGLPPATGTLNRRAGFEAVAYLGGPAKVCEYFITASVRQRTCSFS